MLQCEYCQAPLTGGGVTYELFLNNFSHRYRSLAENRSRKETDRDHFRKLAALVQTINVPSDRAALLHLTAYVSGQVRSIGDNFASTNRDLAAIVLPAWLAKASEISLKLKLTATNDNQVVRAVEELDNLSQYKSASTKVSHATFLSKLRWRFVLPVAIFFTLMALRSATDGEFDAVFTRMIIVGVVGWVAFFVLKKYSKESR